MGPGSVGEEIIRLLSVRLVSLIKGVQVAARGGIEEIDFALLSLLQTVYELLLFVCRYLFYTNRNPFCFKFLLQGCVFKSICLIY